MCGHRRRQGVELILASSILRARGNYHNRGTAVNVRDPILLDACVLHKNRDIRTAKKVIWRDKDLENPVYENLQKRLNMFPTSFPRTEEGLEIEILKCLFTEEAEIAAILPLKGKDAPENIKTMADRTELSVEALSRQLETMAKKGLIYLKGHAELAFGCSCRIIGDKSIKPLANQRKGVVRSWMVQLNPGLDLKGPC